MSKPHVTDNIIDRIFCCTPTYCLLEQPTLSGIRNFSASYPLDILEAASQELFTQTSFDDLKPEVNSQPTTTAVSSTSTTRPHYAPYRLQPVSNQQKRAPTLTTTRSVAQRPAPVVRFSASSATSIFACTFIIPPPT
ncbi:hypothetical protein ANCCAN_30531 [Ancylostoma caninum]|uniref:Uncharacterized protein n=1 Tax=Ancylostoma caninum TaxID=29170 RepID=A0A368EVU1_ANCCA|nr:hypothetical protein ANCCAN_30531 [Ancylostoma caninum]